jgi:sec-independent protein translocase protein TatB
MNGTIFGIGPLEVLVVGILILLIFGPERLPEFTRNIGTALRRLRETYVSFTQEFSGELQPIASDIDAVTREIRQEVEAIRQAADIRSILQPFADDVNKAVKLQDLSSSANSATAISPASAASAAAAIPTNGNTIAPPKSSAGANGKAARAASRPTASAPQLVFLPDDNPWASAGADIRADKLDDDSPWRI